MKDEGFFSCLSCGEENTVPLDLSAGSEQKHVKECSVCRHPNIVHIKVEVGGDVRVWVTAKEADQ